MAKNQPSGPRDLRTSVKGPLAFSAVLAVVAGVATTIFATGGNSRELRLDLGLTAAGIAFIVSLVFAAMLLMTEKPNDESLGKGSGINRSADKIPGGAGTVGGPGTHPGTGKHDGGQSGRDSDGPSAS